MRLSYIIPFAALVAFAEATPSGAIQRKRCEAASTTLRSDPQLLSCSFFKTYELVHANMFADVPSLKQDLTELCSATPCEQDHVNAVWNQFVDACGVEESLRLEYLGLAYSHTAFVTAGCYLDQDGEFTLVNAAKKFEDGPASAFCNKDFKLVAEHIFDYSAEKQLEYYTTETLSEAATLLIQYCGEEFIGDIASAKGYPKEAELEELEENLNEAEE